MGPFKCPDCGTWWAGFEHRCRQPIVTTTPTIQPYEPTTIQWPGCTCAQIPPNYVGDWFCPAHHYTITSIWYSGGSMS